MTHYVDRPGGTLEADLWQVLLLFGTGQTGEKLWQGDVSVAQGDIFHVEGYRFEPPDKVLPQGGWRLTVKPESMQAARIGKWKGVRYALDKPIEIYDLSQDRAERNDLAARHPEVVRRVEQVFAEAHVDSDRFPLR